MYDKDSGYPGARLGRPLLRSASWYRAPMGVTSHLTCSAANELEPRERESSLRAGVRLADLLNRNTRLKNLLAGR